MAKRGKTPTLISGSSGKPSVAEARRKRVCTRCNCNINMGEKLFEIPKVGVGFTAKKSVCKSCFIDILKQTQKDLDHLKSSCDQL